MTHILASKVWVSLLVSGGARAHLSYLPGPASGSEMTPATGFASEAQDCTELGLRTHNLGSNVAQGLQFGVAGLPFLLRGPGDNNRIQPHTGLIPNSYEEILDRKGDRNRGASGAVS